MCPASPSVELPALLEWVTASRSLVDNALLAHGGLLLRGWPVRDAVAFDTLMHALGVLPKPYVGGAAVRHVVHGGVFTSNESPPSETIPFHHEMALVASPPSRIAFFCERPAASGGETSILLSGELCARVAARVPEFCERLEAEGLVYHRVLSEEDDAASAQGRGWKSTYAATKESAEAAMRTTVRSARCLRFSTRFSYRIAPPSTDAVVPQGVSSWQWREDGSLRTSTSALPAFKTDPRTGERLFFNALAAVYLGWTDARNAGPDSVRFGGGGALPAEDVRAVAKEMAALAVDIPWRQGDVMLLDNSRVMHARRPFAPPRRILAYICE